MWNLFLSTAASVALAWSAHAPPATPNADPSTPPAATSAAPTGVGVNAAASAADLSVGLSVKDSAGVAIGQITDLKTDAAGKRVATIKMGASSFKVEADRLAVENGAATVNATEAQLRDMLKKPK